MATDTRHEPTVALRCECGKAYYDENYRGEPCRECGCILG